MATRFSMASAPRRWREGPSGLRPALSWLGRGDGEGGPVTPVPGSRRCRAGCRGWGVPRGQSPGRGRGGHRPSGPCSALTGAGPGAAAPDGRSPPPAARTA